MVDANATKITTAEFSAKFKSKQELFFFLTVECKAYLPPIETCTIYWLKKLMSGERVSITIFHQAFF